MSNAVTGQAAVQSAKTAPKKPAAVNVPPRQAKRTEPITPSAQTTAQPPTAKLPAAPVTRPKPLATLMSTTALDGFSGFNEEVEGDDRPQGGGSMIQGTLVKFTSEGEWVTGSGDPMPPGQELVPSDLVRAVQKWLDGKAAGTIIVPMCWPSAHRILTGTGGPALFTVTSTSGCRHPRSTARRAFRNTKNAAAAE